MTTEQKVDKIFNMLNSMFPEQFSEKTNVEEKSSAETSKSDVDDKEIRLKQFKKDNYELYNNFFQTKKNYLSVKNKYMNYIEDLQKNIPEQVFFSLDSMNTDLEDFDSISKEIDKSITDSFNDLTLIQNLKTSTETLRSALLEELQKKENIEKIEKFN
jgi:molecular chaperone GrpE (heat shock protein)